MAIDQAIQDSPPSAAVRADAAAEPSAEPPQASAPALVCPTARPPFEPIIEHRWKRWVFAILALVVIVRFHTFHRTLWAPAHGGVDQNGYLVGGKMFADHFSTSLRPINPLTGKHDPYLFIGTMWVGADLGTAEERYYPKYPIGLPILYAVGLWVGDVVDVAQECRARTWGPYLAYMVNPICMTLAVTATFLLLRAVVGSFAAVLGTAVVATGPITLALTNNPNSHASTLCCVTWGMYLLVRWWQVGGPWRAVGAGLLIGYAATIRYTEAMLGLPLGLVALFNLRWRSLRSCLETGLLVAGWSIPVLGLACFNLAAMGSWTGYDPTNESSGFRWEYFRDNWETMLRHIHNTGLFFIFPLGIVGLVWMFWWSWKFALVITSWIIPALLVYSAYYFAPDPNDPNAIWTGYLRFFLTVFPALILCAFWLLAHLAQLAEMSSWSRQCTRRQVVVITAVFAGLWLLGWALAFWLHGGLAGWAGRALGMGSHPWALAGMGLAVAAGSFALLALLAWRADGGVRPRHYGVAAGLVAGSITAIVVAENCELWSGRLGEEQRSMLMLKQTADIVRGHGIVPARVPDKAILFASSNVLHHLQFLGDWPLYSVDLLHAGAIRSMANVNTEEPRFLQAQRAKMMYERFKDYTDAQFLAAQQQLIESALDQGAKAYFIVTQAAADQVYNRFAQSRLSEAARRRLGLYRTRPDAFEMRVVASWNDPNSSRSGPAKWTMRKQRPGTAAADPSATTWQLIEVVGRAKPSSEPPRILEPLRPQPRNGGGPSKSGKRAMRPG